MDEQIKPTGSGLAIKLSAIGNEIGKIEKSGENAAQHYRFINYEQINARLSPLFAKYKIAVIPSFDSIEEEKMVGNGKTWIRSIIRGTMEIIDGETGERITKGIIGCDQDTSGKSSSKAITEATKRFFMKLFNVSSLADEDPDSFSTDTPAQKKEPAKKITEKQRRELVTLSKNLAIPQEISRKIISDFGYKTSADILAEHFDEITYAFKSEAERATQAKKNAAEKTVENDQKALEDSIPF